MELFRRKIGGEIVNYFPHFDTIVVVDSWSSTRMQRNNRTEERDREREREVSRFLLCRVFLVNRWKMVCDWHPAKIKNATHTSCKHPLFLLNSQRSICSLYNEPIKMFSIFLLLRCWLDVRQRHIDRHFHFHHSVVFIHDPFPYFIRERDAIQCKWRKDEGAENSMRKIQRLQLSVRESWWISNFWFFSSPWVSLLVGVPFNSYEARS